MAGMRIGYLIAKPELAQKIRRNIVAMSNVYAIEGAKEALLDEEFYQFSKNVVSHFKKVDVVINNAGITNGSITAVDTTIESYEKVLGVNLWGMIYGTLAFMPELRKQKESSVVNISSIWGLLGSPYQSAYSTSKFGIRGFTEA